jgi:hypothetical protein
MLSISAARCPGVILLGCGRGPSSPSRRRSRRSRAGSIGFPQASQEGDFGVQFIVCHFDQRPPRPVRRVLSAPHHDGVQAIRLGAYLASVIRCNRLFFRVAIRSAARSRRRSNVAMLMAADPPT